MLRTSRRRLQQLGRWPRWCAVGICLLLAAASAARARVPRERTAGGPATAVSVVVAARPLAAGHRLVRGDLAVTRWPAALRPSGTTADPGRFVGDRLAGPLAARDLVTTRRVLGATLTAGLAEGQVATPVPLDDTGVVSLVHPGERVDLVATARADGAGGAGTGPPTAAGAGSAPATPAVVVASRAVVLALVDTAAAASGGGGTEIVLATDRTVALRIAGLRSTQVFAVVGDSP